MASSNFRVKNGAEITEVLYVSGASSLRNVGILGPVDPDVAGLTVHGDISATGDLITEASDLRLKDVSGVITDGLSRIQNINPVEFKWNEEAQTKYDADDNPHVGLIAQEVEVTVPEIVKPSPWNGQYKTLQYEKMVPILLSAIKELNEKVEKLEQQLEKHNHE